MLAIDDEADALVLMREILEAAGATVTTLGTPVGAIERIEAARPDVLVVDLGMPEDRRIRSDCPDPQFAEPGRGRHSGRRADGVCPGGRPHKSASGRIEMHLAKPVDPGELVASIATLARRARSLRF